MQRYYEHLKDGMAVEQRWESKGGRAGGLYEAMALLGVASFIMLPIRFVPPATRLIEEERLRRWMVHAFNSTVGRKFRWRAREQGNLATVDRSVCAEVSKHAYDYVHALRINASSATLINFLMFAKGRIPKPLFAALLKLNKCFGLG